MKINSLSLVLLLSVLLLITLSFAAVQAGQIIGLQNGLDAYQEEFKKMEALATSGIQENEQQLKEMAQDQERLEQECGVESDTYVTRRLEHDPLTLNGYRKNDYDADREALLKLLATS